MSQMIPESEIERVKRETDLLALVRSRGIELKAHGSKDWVGRCPFHKDNDNPNFIITPGKGLFHCMACGAAGNAIQFVRQLFHSVGGSNEQCRQVFRPDVPWQCRPQQI